MSENTPEYLLRDHFLNIGVCEINRQNIKVGRQPYSRSDFIAAYNTEDTWKASVGALEPLPKENIRLEYFKTAISLTMKYLSDERNSNEKQKFEGWDDLREKIIQIDWSHYQPIQDIKTNEIRLVTRDGKISDFDYDAWIGMVDYAYKEEHTQNIPRVLAEYDPYNISTFAPTTFEDMEVTRVNLYNAPDWRKKSDPRAPCPPRIKKFLKHLFPALENRVFVINWLRVAMLQRCETYLVLNGAKGIGKNVFTDLAGALVGREHFSLASSSLLTGHFNAVLDKKRLILLDELKVGKSEHVKLKRFINEDQSIEKKGKDADKTTKTYNSYIIANNDLVDMHIETDDRRFSVPDLTDLLLQNVFTQEDIDGLIEDIKDPEVIREFGYFVYNFDSENGHTAFSTCKGQRFWDLAYTSLTEWQKYIVDKILSRDKDMYFVKSMARRFNEELGHNSRFPRNIDKLKDFFKSYLHRGAERIARVEKDEGEWAIIPSKNFAPEGFDDTLYGSSEEEDEIEGLL